MEKNENKAVLYDEYVRNGNRLEREISKLKSDYVTNIPEHIQKEIDGKKAELVIWTKKLENLYY